MSIPLVELLADFSKNAPVSEQYLQSTEKVLGKSLPADYRNFMLYSNGGEGFIGKHYVISWKTEELSKFNEGYEVSKYAPGFLMFGSTGGGDGFAFDTRKSPFQVIQMPFIGMGVDEGFFVAHSLNELLEKMLITDGPLF